MPKIGTLVAIVIAVVLLVMWVRWLRGGLIRRRGALNEVDPSHNSAPGATLFDGGAGGDGGGGGD